MCRLGCGGYRTEADLFTFFFFELVRLDLSFLGWVPLLVGFKGELKGSQPFWGVPPKKFPF